MIRNKLLFQFEEILFLSTIPNYTAARIFSLFFLTVSVVFAGPVPVKLEYIFPKHKDTWIVKESPVILRFNNIVPEEISNLDTFIRITGEKSGRVSGKTIISSDGKTLIFKPDFPFVAEENVTVQIKPCMAGQTAARLDTTFTFTVAPHLDFQRPVEPRPPLKTWRKSTAQRYQANQDGVVVLNGVSVPSDFPYIDITVNDNPDTGYIFCNHTGGRNFNLILDNSGAPVFYWIVPDDRRDFKLQPTGVITMTVREGFGGGGFCAINNTYTVVDTFFVPPGYAIDEHDLLVRENGNYLVTAMDQRFVDMSELVPGGYPNARVTGYHLLEMDADDNPVFIWRCWDHYKITDAEYVDLTARNIDFLHTNSIAVDLDGHYLTTPKLLDEITKINSRTGEIIWRLGGKNNQFTYTNFDEFISRQHDVSVLPNGNYTVFDNGNFHEPPYSRALEFKVDTDDMTVTRIWEFRDTPDRYAHYQGNVQRLPNGNTLINWVLPQYPKLCEVRPDGSKAFEMNFIDQINCYRVFRFPWKGHAAVPFLVTDLFSDRVVLLFNKFGDPDVEIYRVYGGPNQNPDRLMGTTGQPYMVLDENDITDSGTYYFRVSAVDSHGNESGFSNEEMVRTNFIPADINMISNGTFSGSMSDWNLTVSGSALAATGTANDECTVVIQQGGANLEDIRLVQNGLTLYEGQTYTFEFDVRADKARSIDAHVESSIPPYTNYGRIGLSYVTTTLERQSYTFVMENSTTSTALVVFNVGSDDGNVTIDNVALIRNKPSLVEARSDEGGFSLYPVYPNPFNVSATISFDLPLDCFVTCEIYDILGRRVDNLLHGKLIRGRHTRLFSGGNHSSGVYFCRITADALSTGQRFYDVKRMILLK
ncbi:aryl-sulfate sulfotransferase [candidate division KSB1 bacterium]|nr:aryl-sulfate sulfotransferase [candidate division KSB1 bacterium]